MGGDIESALRTALKNASDGAHYYDMAAKNMKSHAMRDIFKTLAKEEKEHYKTILKFYEHFTETGRWLETSLEEVLERLSHKIDNALLKESIEDVKVGASELSTISTAVLLEEESIKFYKERENEEEDPTIKEFYEALAKIEAEQHSTLVKVEKKLIEKVWKHNRYSPL